MSSIARLRHSAIGRTLRRLGHVAFSLRHRGEAPVLHRLPGGTTVRLLPRGDVAEFLFYAPFFEREHLRLVSAFLRPGMRVVDVGANSGLYTILAARLVGESGHVWALEPSSETYELLTRNIELNRPVSVTSLAVAAADRDDMTMLLRSDPGFGDAYRYLAPGPARESEEGAAGDCEIVAVTTLDALAEKLSLGRVDFLKLDIEGGEYRALLGARAVLEANEALVIMFESDPQWCTRAGCRREDVFRLLESLGFGIHAWNPRRRRWLTGARNLRGRDILWAARDHTLLPTPSLDDRLGTRT